ncbi:hypothetical protein glysoja_046185 [Glycine soja]|uniref:Uncharacterized protein n=1 Tax=Glycine soja TaxID=3848 RepID=A0A0B2NYC1_GLYSO|nr:hypothetical protein glysoja_046185 [Glycine soja]
MNGSEKEDRGCYLGLAGWVLEKGHGSAMDMASRNWVRQISESVVGMFDMVFKRG